MTSRNHTPSAPQSLRRQSTDIKQTKTRQHAPTFPTFMGVRTQGDYDPQIQTRPRFLYSVPTPKFHHPTFTHSKVIALRNEQTNKQTDTVENIQRSLLCYDVAYKDQPSDWLCHLKLHDTQDNHRAQIVVSTLQHALSMTVRPYSGSPICNKIK